MKTVLAEKIPNIRGFMKAEAKGIVEELLEIMKNPFAEWKDVIIIRFGKRSVRSKHHWRDRNPQTG